MISLQGKVVLITGASSGIGWETALELARRGARVVAVARNAAKLEELRGLLPGEASQHLIFPADVTAEPMMAILLETIREKFGRLDILINNAAVGYLSPLGIMKMEILLKIFETNYFALVRLTQLALPLLKASRGHIINISSVIGRISIPHYAAYCSSKFALEAFSEAIRPELAPHGVRVSVVCPALTESRFSENSFREMPPRPRWRPPKSAASVARAIARVAARPRRDLVLTLGGRALLLAHRHFPRLLDRIFVKHICRR